MLRPLLPARERLGITMASAEKDTQLSHRIE